MTQTDDLRTLEHSTLKVPYEILNKQYRNMQKSIDRDCSSLSTTVINVEKLIKQSESLSKADLLNSFNTIVDKLRSIRKRSSEFKNEEKTSIDLIKKRIEHLKQHESCSNVENQLNIKMFKRLRIDRMLVDYFLRQGLYDTAQLLASKNNIEVNCLISYIKAFLIIRINCFFFFLSM
jgi:macrophage erythroblast attacher